MNHQFEINEFYPEANSGVTPQPWQAEFLAARQLILITACGHFFRDDARELTGEVSRLMRNHGTNRVLADFSAAGVEIPLTDIYWFPAHYAAVGCSPGFRVAVVVPATGYRREAFEFYQLRCANMGFDVRLFKDGTAAEKWLRQPAAGAN